MTRSLFLPLVGIVPVLLLVACSAAFDPMNPTAGPSLPPDQQISGGTPTPTPVPTARPGGTASPAPTAVPTPAAYQILALAGDASGSAGNTGDGGSALLAEFNSPAGVALSGNGSVLIADYGNHKIRAVSPAGIVSTFAGFGAFGFAGDGGPAIDAQFDHPFDVASAPGGDVAIADYGNDRVRQVDGQGIVTTIAGGGTLTPVASGSVATASILAGPAGLAYDAAGNLYLCEFNGARVDRLAPSGTLTVIAGTGATGSIGDEGPALSAELDQPIAVLPDNKGDVYIADFAAQRVRMVDPSGIIHTVAGTGVAGSAGDGGPAVDADLHGPAALALLPDGTLLVADSGNSEIRAISPAGTIRTIAGTGSSGNAGDGGPALAAQLADPLGLVASGSGVVVSDFGDNRIRELVPTN